jgi:hypothetical protein
MRLEGLRERVKGTYDLDKAEDCQKVIKVLLRGSDNAHRTAEEAKTKLRALALDVVNERFEAKERAATALRDDKPVKRNAGELMGFLSKMAKEITLAEDMTDEELVSEILNGLWANLDLHSEDSALLGELVRRFQGGKRQTDSSD